MKKNFITVTPDSGTSGSSNTISVAAEPNILLKERSEILNFNASGGVSKSVQVIQNAMPYFPIRFPFVLNMNKFIGCITRSLFDIRNKKYRSFRL